MNNYIEYNRHSFRKKGYDYSHSGIYFITICTENKIHLFGKITNGKMQLNDTGKIVAKEWIKTAEIRKEVELDEWTIMPNHFHSIIKITHRRGTAHRAHPIQQSTRQTKKSTHQIPQFATPIPNSLPTIIRSFKSAVTKGINELNNQPGIKLWQRNYWEHIIRDDDELCRIRQYIKHNPINWKSDRLRERR